MGRRAGYESLSSVFQAFLRQRTWRQADLAREAELVPAQLRRVLCDLTRNGMPLERIEERPDVFWSVPKTWFPGGIALSQEDVVRLLRLLGRVPRGRSRDELMGRLLGASPAVRACNPADTIVALPSRQEEDAWLELVEDAAARRVTLRFKYFSANRGAMEWRHASPQRIAAGPPARLCAVCHRDGRLKWFRVDGVVEAHLDHAEPFRQAPAAEVERFFVESLDGFHQADAAAECVFVVRFPEARWVERNLPGPGFVAEAAGANGRRFRIVTRAPLRLARFVVGLGDAARVETPLLRALVADLARGALAATETDIQ